MEKLFKIRERGSSVRAEVMGGLTTFFAMAYIIFVNPSMLCADLGGGFCPAMPVENMIGVAVATCLAAVIGSTLTAFMANAPFVQAPGMGLNSFFTYTVCLGMGFTWQQALTIVFISGLIFLIVAISPVRPMIISAVPANLKLAIGAGIGLFITLIGLVNSGLINFSAGVPALGELTGAHLLCVIGLVVTILLMVMNIKGAIFLGIIATAVIGLIPSLCGWDVFGTFVTEGTKLYDFSTIGDITKVAFKFDFGGLFSNGVLPVVTAVLSFAMVDCFDTVGTLIGTAGSAGLLKEDGTMDGGDKALVADAIATVAGSALGTSTTTTFVESSAGVAAGGRTGLTALTSAVLFLTSMLFAPIFTAIPSFATTPALVFVGFLMFTNITKINLDDSPMDETIPAYLCLLSMPLTYSIAEGISFGMVSYVLLKLVCGKGKEVKPLMYLLTALFICKYIFL